MENRFAIRKAGTQDVPRMVAIINSVYRGEGSKRGWTTEADLISGELRTDEADLLGLMAKPTATFLICEETADAVAVGCVYLDRRGGRLYLGMLSVDLDWQASGIGKRLLTAAEEHARSQGCSSIFMQVIPVRSELMAWYARNGYASTGERKPFDGNPRFGVPKEPLEFVILEKRI
jgi:predicted N-acetyltransferase YhbS